jgi:RNA polymerase sigma-70 factor (ECF subfamily)
MEPLSTAASGVAADFDGIYAREFGYVVKTLRRLGVVERDLPDVAQEVFLRVYEALSSFDSARPVRPWLFGFALRTASNHSRLWRHRNVRPATEPVDDAGVQDSGPTPEASLAAAEDRARLIGALQALSLERRAVVVLHEIDGLPIPQVATALQIPLNTAYSRLRRGLADLATALRRERGTRGR